MRNLIIIGNGFDLAHGLKTSYYDFISDLKSGGMKYNFLNIEDNHLINSLNAENKMWSDIEAAYFDILTHLGNDSYIRHKYGSGISNYNNVEDFNTDFEELKLYLIEYLIEEENKFVPIENYTELFKYLKWNKTLILNFNYTITVSYYIRSSGIKQIQIHGNLENTDNPMIFGFAASNKESKDLLIKNNNNFVSNIKKFNYLYTNNELSLKTWMNEEDFNLFILGHSCGISDKLILHQIFNSTKLNKIIPFYYKNRQGYFDMMVNIDRIIDDYSKSRQERVAFNKLATFPNSYKIPQWNDPKDENLLDFISNYIIK